MSGTATAWPGQEVVQWPGQEVQAGQGEHGYAPAPPETVKSDTGPFDPVEPSYPDYVQRPLTVPDAVTGASMVDDYGRPVGATPAAPEPVRHIVGAMGEGWRATPSILTPEAQDAQYRLYGPVGGSIVNSLFSLAGAVPAATNALMYGGAELANQATGDPRAGRDALMLGQTALTLGGAVPRVGAPTAGPRANPMMDAFTRAEAERAAQPSRPQPMSEAESGIARTHAQLGFGPDNPPPPPDMTATPADRAPAFVPRVNIDPLTGQPATTQVPTVLRLQAAIDAAGDRQPGPQPGFAPPGAAAPPVDRVPPGAAGPATIPPAPPEPPMLMRDSPWPADATQPTPAPGAAPAEPPGPRSVGAAASRDMTNPASLAVLTPEQAALYGSVADKQWLYKTKRPGEADNTVYLDGINPTMAQREQTAVAAREMKTQRNLSPEADQAERELLDDHNTIRKNEYQGVAGSDVTQGIDIDAAEKKIDDALGKAFSSGGEVDPQVVTRAIQAERTAPSGKLPPVKAVMKVVADAMQKEDGSGLETNPTQVYGVRRVINYLQSKNAIAENPAYGSPDVQAALIRVKNAIDGAIEPVAPGFTQAIGDYATARQAFDAREALQKAESKLYDGQGRMQYLPFHRFMNEVIQSRDPRAPLNPYQSLTETQMARLKSIHDDLQRVASAEDLAKARGSDSAMNFMDAAKEAAQGLPGTLAAGLAGHVVGGPAGIVLGPIVKQGVQGVFTRRAERAATEKMGRLLRPDPEQYPTRPNPLFNPDAAP